MPLCKPLKIILLFENSQQKKIEKKQEKISKPYDFAQICIYIYIYIYLYSYSFTSQRAILFIILEFF